MGTGDRRWGPDNEPGLGNELLCAAERALFDATARLQEALCVIERESALPAPAMLARARQWAALIEAGLAELDRRRPGIEPPGDPLRA